MPQTIEYRPVVVEPSRPSILQRIKAAYRSYTIAPIPTRDPALAKLFGAGYETTSGIVVNQRTAFTFSAVFDAVNQLSSDVAKLPLNLLKRREGGGSDPYVESKLYRLLKYEPNPDMGSMVFRRTLMAHALTCKGAFAEIERDGSGRPAALWPLTPERVEPKLKPIQIGGGRFRTRLQYRIDGDDQRMIDAADMLHIHGIGYDGYIGYETIHSARQAIGMALAAEKFGASVFKHGRFGGLLTTEDFLDPTSEQAQEIASKVQQYKQGFEQFLLLFGAKWKYDKTGIGPQDAQMEAIRDQQVEEVARFFNMPLHKLKLNKPGAVSYASVEMSDLDYYKGPILNWVTLFEEEFNRKLIPSLEAKQQYVKHNANAFLRGDIKSRYDALGIALDKGVINADEWRELEDMNPQPDGQGKLYLVQGAMVPKNKIEAIAEATITKKSTQKPAPAAPAPAQDPDPGGRAARAEALLQEAQARESEARTKLAALEATHTATAEELEDRRAEVQRLSLQTGQLGIVVEFVRDRASTLEAARTTAETERAAAREALAAEQEGRRLAEAREAQAVQELVELRAVAADADISKHTASALEVTAREERDRLLVTLEQTTAARDHAAAELADMRHLLSMAESGSATVRTERDELQKEVNDWQTEVTELQARIEFIQGQLKTQADAEADALAVQIQSHRELVVSIMRRMVERETDKGRQAQGTESKRQKWLETFYDAHADLMRKSLLPAIRIHLAFIRSSDDPVDVTRRVVETHVQRSEIELRQVLDGDADASALTALFYRWDQERPSELADRLMAKELDYARRR